MDCECRPANLRGQAFYASGQDSGDDDIKEYFGTNGQSYYWAEIMGNGTFDNTVSIGSPGNKISNIWAANIGATIKPMEKLSLSGDIWYAAHVEDDFVLSGEKELGVEIDIRSGAAEAADHCSQQNHDPFREVAQGLD